MSLSFSRPSVAHKRLPWVLLICFFSCCQGVLVAGAVQLLNFPRADTISVVMILIAIVSALGAVMAWRRLPASPPRRLQRQAMLQDAAQIDQEAAHDRQQG